MDAQINLPSDLHSRVEREADARGMSVVDFVRESLEQAIARSTGHDALFSDNVVFRDDGPTDAASHHDDYLYGDAS